MKYNDHCTAGIAASVVLVVNVIVNYQQKLTDFLADLASEGGQGEVVAKVD